MDNVQLAALKEELEREYGEIKARGLALNMARGKPSAKQLELALGVLEALKARSEFANSNGDDCRNYGLLGRSAGDEAHFSPIWSAYRLRRSFSATIKL